MATVTVRAAATGAAAPAARPRIGRGLPAALALVPTALIVLVVYVGCMLWTVRLSFTSSTLLPKFDFVGLAQYERLILNDRFVVSAQNTVIFGVLFIAGCLVLGFLLAVFIDQRVKGEGAFRTVFLFPYSMSFVVTGVAWQWFLNPGLGLEKLVRDMGFSDFTFDWLVNQEMAIYTLVIAGIWHGAGLTMAILLAGLRGVDEDLWKAARVDGVPPWRYYLSIVLPLLRPMVVTATVLLAISVVKLYDLVVAMTGGGPGIATEVPAKFVMDHLFERNNIALGTAAATLMLVTVVIIIAPWIYARYVRSKGRR
ncbi:sugar ABC transporter permease [Chelatococcus daeguensis]|uniref:Carbohydrate ABC transporter membrane protein 1, CUT1 family (TC 3.A.1.1.-) n=1 Tax=Chelatococcus sambhunathii TaxID=363953 RepID=A0ABP2A0I9_9HYPH|nr:MULTISPECIES: sugar ABC transporter permease [Chelatococcus]KZE35485.1 sugar ABC transporter permease [Chelatococcus daeguensis]MBM3085483.1 sugar ABC transporter permease [Chelatococcus daeguensis]CUA86129.1 carbohydrate ABC transporter membrane protein 1, CUT1 family (TC 3.A.1.1.-) [Chelatococcus sambhunathii]